MRNSKYLVRFDDICPTMDWGSWNILEKHMLGLDIKPILAIVPDNRDKKLIVSKKNNNFWARVKSWQDNGWSIAIHGYQHLYQTRDSGLMKLNKYSEFSGLSYELQREKLKKALKIFESHGITPKLWIAPAHSFDKVTISALSDLGIKVISDGFFTRPVKHMNMIWVPQQLWRFRDFQSGTWTVCHHINGVSKMQLEKICGDFNKYKNRIVGLEYILKKIPIKPFNTIDYIFSIIWLNMVKVKKLLNRLQ